jgi:uncharacterized integral membrane protein
MSEYQTGPTPTKAPKKGLSGRAIGGIIVAALVVVFIAINRDQTTISFLFVTVQMALWIALTIAAVGGLIAGFLIGRKRYKGPS